MHDPRVKVRDVSIVVLPVPARGVLGLRLKIKETVDGRRTTLVFDSFVFRHGPVEVQLATVSSPRPFASTEQRRVLKLLLARAGAGPIAA